MATFVLVGGLWTGAWVWDDTVRALAVLGHAGHPVSLDGIAERRAALGPHIDLEHHVADLLDRIAPLSDVMLVAHSYAAVVAGMVADRSPERLARLVYVDGWPLPDGRALMEGFSAEAARFVQTSLAGDGWSVPLPGWRDLEQTIGASLTGIDTAGLARFRALATPHPAGTMRQPSRRRARDRVVPTSVILNTVTRADLRARVAEGHAVFTPMTAPEWRFIAQPTGHWPMLSEPTLLADNLAAASRGEGAPL